MQIYAAAERENLRKLHDGSHLDSVPKVLPVSKTELLTKSKNHAYIMHKSCLDYAQIMLRFFQKSNVDYALIMYMHNTAHFAHSVMKTESMHFLSFTVISFSLSINKGDVPRVYVAQAVFCKTKTMLEYFQIFFVVGKKQCLNIINICCSRKKTMLEYFWVLLWIMIQKCSTEDG